MGGQEEKGVQPQRNRTVYSIRSLKMHSKLTEIKSSKGIGYFFKYL